MSRRELTPEQRREIAQYVEDRLDARLRVTPWYDARGWDALPVGIVVFIFFGLVLGIACVVPEIVQSWRSLG